MIDRSKLILVILPSIALSSLILIIPHVLSQQEQQFSHYDDNTSVRFTHNPVIINYSAIPESIEKGKNLLLNITLINRGKDKVENLNIDVVSAGFKTINKNPLVNEIFPNSTIRSQYMLEATNTGKHAVYLNSMYAINSTKNITSTLPIQVSNISAIGRIDVIDRPFYVVEWSSFSQGIVSSLVGLAAGAGLAKLAERSKQKDIEIKEKLKIRRLLLYDLKRLETALKYSRNVDTNDFVNLNMLTTMGMYYLEENQKLKEKVIEFYTELNMLPSLQTSDAAPIREARKTKLIGLITEIRDLVTKSLSQK